MMLVEETSFPVCISIYNAHKSSIHIYYISAAPINNIQYSHCEHTVSITVG